MGKMMTKFQFLRNLFDMKTKLFTEGFVSLKTYQKDYVNTKEKIAKYFSQKYYFTKKT